MRERGRAGAFRESVTGADVELAYAGFDRFLKGEERAFDDVDDVDAAVVGVPYDGAVSNRPGARYGPAAIREASGWWAYISDYKGGLTNMQTGKNVDFGNLEVADCGDVPVFPMDHETTAESITAHVAALAAQTFPVLLGGDHYCTFPSVRGFAEGRDTTASASSRSTPTPTPSRRARLRHRVPRIEYGPDRRHSVRRLRERQPGRDPWLRIPDFFEFADETGLNLYTMREVEDRGIGDVVSDAVEAAADGTDAVYVSFDIDAVDPSVAPGTGTPIPGGLSAQQALETMEVLGAHDAVSGADLMEVSPRYDSTEGTQRLAAYLLVTLLERAFAE